MDLSKATSDVPLTYEAIQDTDDGFLIVGRSCGRRGGNTLPIFVKAKGCGGFEGPRKPAMLAERIDNDVWDRFVQDTVKILSQRFRRMQGGLLAFGLLMYLPLLCVPALREPDYDNNYEASAKAANLYLVYTIGLVLTMGVSLFTCLRMNGEGAHREIREVQNKYAADFQRGNIDLLYIRDGAAAYWVFRPVVATANGKNGIV